MPKMPFSLPATKWDLAVRAVRGIWGNCLDPIRRLEMIGFIDRPCAVVITERGATLLSGPHCSLRPKNPALIWIWDDSKVPIMHICARALLPSSAVPGRQTDKAEARETGRKIRRQDTFKCERTEPRKLFTASIGSYFRLILLSIKNRKCNFDGR